MELPVGRQGSARLTTPSVVHRPEVGGDPSAKVVQPTDSRMSAPASVVTKVMPRTSSRHPSCLTPVRCLPVGSPRTTRTSSRDNHATVWVASAPQSRCLSMVTLKAVARYGEPLWQLIGAVPVCHRIQLPVQPVSLLRRDDEAFCRCRRSNGEHS